MRKIYICAYRFLYLCLTKNQIFNGGVFNERWKWRFTFHANNKDTDHRQHRKKFSRLRNDRRRKNRRCNKRRSQYVDVVTPVQLRISVCFCFRCKSENERNTKRKSFEVIFLGFGFLFGSFSLTRRNKNDNNRRVIIDKQQWRRRKKRKTGTWSSYEEQQQKTWSIKGWCFISLLIKHNSVGIYFRPESVHWLLAVTLLFTLSGSADAPEDEEAPALFDDETWELVFTGRPWSRTIG